MTSVDNRTVLHKVEDDSRYVSEDGIVVLSRENGLTPSGSPLFDRWVLRINGEFIDFDQYRNDIAERQRLDLKSR